TGYEWQDAYADARRSSYKDVAGRLAIVTSIATHEFLLRTFRPNTSAWIGLRYLCKERKLVDSVGRDQSHAPFAAWARNWKPDTLACVVNPYIHDYDPGDYSPVAYAAESDGFLWKAVGRHKGYDAYFIEYPTGHP